MFLSFTAIIVSLRGKSNKPPDGSAFASAMPNDKNISARWIKPLLDKVFIVMGNHPNENAGWRIPTGMNLLPQKASRMWLWQ
jgi:hypothetical protein